MNGLAAELRQRVEHALNTNRPAVTITEDEAADLVTNWPPVPWPTSGVVATRLAEAQLMSAAKTLRMWGFPARIRPIRRQP